MTVTPVTPENLSPAALRLYEQVRQLEVDGESEGWPWATLCAAGASPIDVLHAVLAEGEVPWGPLFDVETCPDELLPFLSNFYGVELTPGGTPDQWRSQLRELEGFGRGRPATVIAAALRSGGLVDGAIVTNYERTPEPGRSVTITYASQTTDPARVWQAMESVTSARVQRTYNVDPGWSIGQMVTAYEGQTVGDLVGDFATIGDLVQELPQP